MDPRLLEVAMQNLPAVVALIRAAFAKAHPDAPVPTDSEIHDAYIAARDQTLAVDEEWLRTHPGA